MNEKEYRELRFSPLQLIIMFLGLIVVCSVIFLLGVSVGKKQARLKGFISETTPIKKTMEMPKKKVQKLPETSIEPKYKRETLKPENERFMKGKALYYIQIGAFTTRSRASLFAEKFIKQGYSTIILEPFISDKTPIYRVRIGGFDTEEEAKKVKDELEKKEKSKFIIIKK